MPIAVPAPASSAIWLVAESASGGLSKTTGSLTGPGGRYSMCSSGAAAALPSKESAVRVPVPVIEEGHVVERRPARAVDDLLHDRREVRRALGEAGLARPWSRPPVSRPRRRRSSAREDDVELDGW